MIFPLIAQSSYHRLKTNLRNEKAARPCICHNTNLLNVQRNPISIDLNRCLCDIQRPVWLTSFGTKKAEADNNIPGRDRGAIVQTQIHNFSISRMISFKISPNYSVTILLHSPRL